MTKFNVLCRVDAYVDYVAEVEAVDAEEAAQLANAVTLPAATSGRSVGRRSSTRGFTSLSTIKATRSKALRLATTNAESGPVA